MCDILAYLTDIFDSPSCPEPTCPEPLPQVGSYSSQVIVRDCVFHENDQALVVWSDWGSFSDSWISTR